MKYLTDYTKEAQSKLFKELKVMFAFSDEQLAEGMEENGIKDKKGLISLGAGLILPEKNLKEFKNRMDSIVKEGQALDLAENGKDGVLERELANYEIGYATRRWNDENFRDGIDGYNFTEEEIKNAYYKHIENHEY